MMKSGISNRTSGHQSRKPLRKLISQCYLPCWRHYRDSDSGSDIQQESLLDRSGSEDDEANYSLFRDGVVQEWSRCRQDGQSGSRQLCDAVQEREQENLPPSGSSLSPNDGMSTLHPLASPLRRRSRQTSPNTPHQPSPHPRRQPSPNSRNQPSPNARSSEQLNSETPISHFPMPRFNSRMWQNGFGRISRDTIPRRDHISPASVQNDNLAVDPTSQDSWFLFQTTETQIGQTRHVIDEAIFHHINNNVEHPVINTSNPQHSNTDLRPATMSLVTDNSTRLNQSDTNLNQATNEQPSVLPERQDHANLYDRLQALNSLNSPSTSQSDENCRSVSPLDNNEDQQSNRSNNSTASSASYQALIRHLLERLSSQNLPTPSGSTPSTVSSSNGSRATSRNNWYIYDERMAPQRINSRPQPTTLENVMQPPPYEETQDQTGIGVNETGINLELLAQLGIFPTEPPPPYPDSDISAPPPYESNRNSSENDTCSDLISVQDDSSDSVSSSENPEIRNNNLQQDPVNFNFGSRVRPPIRWNTGMRPERWASSQNWLCDSVQ